MNINNIKNGDKLVATKTLAGFFEEGEVVVVKAVVEGIIVFEYDGNPNSTGHMDFASCEEFFTKMEDVAAENHTNTVTIEQVEAILSMSDIEAHTVFDKCTVVSCRLPNGFVIVESSACVDPENYDEEVGIDICLDKITDKIWELEGYRLQEELYQMNHGNDICGCCDCDSCPCNCDCDEECDVEVEIDIDIENDVVCEECGYLNCNYYPVKDYHKAKYNDNNK